MRIVKDSNYSQQFFYPLQVTILVWLVACGGQVSPVNAPAKGQTSPMSSQTPTSRSAEAFVPKSDKPSASDIAKSAPSDDATTWLQQRLAGKGSMLHGYALPAPSSRFSELGFNTKPPTDWTFDVNHDLERSGLRPHGGWMFTAFASQPQCVMESSSTPAARMEVFYLPVRGAEEMPRKQLVGLLVFVLKYKTGSVAESSVRTDDSMNEPTRTSASGHLSEKIRVAHRTTLPRRLEPNSVNHYSFALEIREDKSGKWRRHWVLLRVGHEILYIVLGVPGDHTPHNQQLVALMDSIVLRSSQDQPGSASNSQEEPRDEQ